MFTTFTLLAAIFSFKDLPREDNRLSLLTSGDVFGDSPIVSMGFTGVLSLGNRDISSVLGVETSSWGMVSVGVPGSSSRTSGIFSLGRGVEATSIGSFFLGGEVDLGPPTPALA